jgi:hypothetical protein
MIRITTKIGDVFSVRLGDNGKRYFQYIANDLIQLNSDVIRVFKIIYPVNANPDLAEIVKDEVVFATHCVIKLGLKMNLWEKMGNIPIIDTVSILFRCSNDYGSKPGEQIHVSRNWRVWKMGDEDFTRVGELPDGYRNAEIGIIVTPVDIITRIRTGKYDFVYPGYQ